MASCSSPAAKDGDVVKVHYTGTLADGTQFDSSVGRDPLEFTVGAGQMIPGFDRAVVGMKVGEKKTITIPAADAYGEYDPEMVKDVPRSDLPDSIDPEVGMQLRAGNSLVTITAVTDDSVTIDFNHQLAGKDLTFEIELVSIGQ